MHAQTCLFGRENTTPGSIGPRATTLGLMSSIKRSENLEIQRLGMKTQRPECGVVSNTVGPYFV